MTTEVTVGEARTVAVCAEVTRTQIVQFAGASGDLSVLHTDEPAARALGHPSVLGHGMMSMALAARLVQEWFGADAVRSIEVRFTAPVWPGDALTARATVLAVVHDQGDATAEVGVELVNGDGGAVLRGTARVVVDTLSNPE